MNIVKDAYETLCRARDALDAGPPEGPEHDALFNAYLHASMKQMSRATAVPQVIHPVPAMNQRFFMILKNDSTDCIEIELPMPEGKVIYGSGDGRGWDSARGMRRLRAKIPVGMSARNSAPVMHSAPFTSSDAISLSLLEIWQRYDATALDVLPITLTSRRGQPLAEEYALVDVVRRLPALDLDTMNVFLYRRPKGWTEEFAVFPPPRAFALRDDLQTEGMHLFRDTHYPFAYFISAELRQACLDAGFRNIPFAPPETPDRPVRE